MIRIERLKFRHLNCLVALAEHGSSVRAATALSVTQSAVSKTLAELEEIVGRKLFTRTRKGVEPTVVGRVLLRYASRSIHALVEGIQKISNEESMSEPMLLVGALPTTATTILPKALLKFRASHPLAHVRIRTGTNVQLIAALREGELDLVLGRLSEPSEMKGLAFEHLYSEPLVFAVRPTHPLLRRRSVDCAALMGYCLLLPDLGTSVREVADQFFLTAGGGLPEDKLESIDPGFCRNYALRSNAIWCSPAGVLESDFRTKLLTRLPIDTETTRGPVGLTLRAEPTHEALRDLVEQVRGAAAGA